MNKLYFVKFQNRLSIVQAVWLGTAQSPEQAQALAWELIAPLYRGFYDLKECTFICNTPDEVINFEPV